MKTPAPFLEQIDEQEQDEGYDQHDDRDGGRAPVIVLLKLGDDEQGNDFAVVRLVPRDEHDREPYSPSARAKAMAKPVMSAGISSGRMTRVIVCQRLAPSVAAASSISGCNSASTGWSVRTTKGSPMKVSATKIPGRSKASFVPEQPRPIHPVERSHREPMHARGSRAGRATPSTHPFFAS